MAGTPVPYWELDGFEHVALEESFIERCLYARGEFKLHLDLVLNPQHPHYTPPKPGELFCFAPAVLKFMNITQFRCSMLEVTPGRDATDAIDFGNIDVLTAEAGRYNLACGIGVYEITCAKIDLQLEL